MMKPMLHSFLLLATTSLLLAGCGNTFGVKEVDYTRPPPPANDHVQIYVFREDSSFGGARKFSVINNDMVVGVLTPGTYTHYTVMDGENEVVIHMSPSPLNHLRVTNRPDETVYLFFHMGYASGTYLKEISEERANELMQSFKYTEIDVKGAKAKMDYKKYYDSLYN